MSILTRSDINWAKELGRKAYEKTQAQNTSSMSRMFATVYKTYSDGTMDVSLGDYTDESGTTETKYLYGLRMTENCIGAIAGDRVIVDTYAHISVVTGVLATSNTPETLAVSYGGTGKTTHTVNAVLTGNGTSAIKNVATANGALYATATNGAAKFGTLPLAQGGTGATTAAAARTNLGIKDYVSSYGTTSVTSPAASWKWQIWASGRKECWTTFTSTSNATITTAWGSGLVVSTFMKLPKYPFTFSAKPNLFGEYLYGDSGATGNAVYMSNRASQTTSTPGEFQLMRSAGSTATIEHPVIALYAIGT